MVSGLSANFTPFNTSFTRFFPFHHAELIVFFVLERYFACHRSNLIGLMSPVKLLILLSVD